MRRTCVMAALGSTPCRGAAGEPWSRAPCGCIRRSQRPKSAAEVRTNGRPPRRGAAGGAVRRWRAGCSARRRAIGKAIAGNASLLLAAGPMPRAGLGRDAAANGFRRPACRPGRRAREAFDGGRSGTRAIHACLEIAAARCFGSPEARAIRRALENPAPKLQRRRGAAGEPRASAAIAECRRVGPLSPEWLRQCRAT